MKRKLLLTLYICISIGALGQIKEISAIDSIFTAYNKKDVPGCALGIIKDGQLIYAKGYGLANMEYNIPNAATSVFRIGSTSKQFTAACIVLLAEKNKLSLDDNLKSIFPDFPEYAEKITIKHLLNHTSGIRDYLQISYLKGLGDDDFYTDTHIMKWLINQTDLNFAPGEEFLYSNSGYWLLGQIVNKVAGVNMAQFAKKEIFEPLKMNNTHFHNDHTQIVKNRASGYMPDNNENYKISMTTLDMIGDGGIFTTINDIKKWDDAFYESNVLSKAFWNVMTQQGILNNGKEINYAAGLMINTYKGLKTIRHGGAFVGFRAELLRFPEQKLSIAIFANRGDANPSSMANQVAEVLLKDKLIEDVSQKAKKVKVDVPKEEFKLSQLVGDYEIQPGIVVRLAIKNDSLNVFQNWNKSTYNIVKVSGNTYQIPKKETISFTFSNIKDNFTETLTVLQSGSKTIAPRKKEIDISGVNLKDYTGSYYSKELDVNYNFKIENEILLVTIDDTQSTIECTISGLDQFVTELGIIRFQRKENLITGFELDSGRVKNLKFKK
ncbi:beta-lactamase family protein [Polaribacter vadi]|uniref:serine hydrolase domain-containing protein n=1 Tax=Polaribacter TaxID=52959 RepID=UPI001C0906F6|nr:MULTISPECIES: serine hydrolase domain-containing protein [Polaribacter]MBU3012331.1 beta-lactamase family protein [Polaribacter vadi]MDO6742148.1 serine hydrolase domain-containing protein [Polaribacter sp. 1_MG-2023]